MDLAAAPSMRGHNAHKRGRGAIYAVEQANTGPLQEDDPLVKLLRSASAKR